MPKQPQRDLSSLLAEAAAGRPGPRGKWRDVEAVLAPAEVAQLAAWLDDPAGPTAAALARVINRLGVEVSESTVQKWANARRR